MGRSVTITTPIPTLEEVGKRLKMGKARQRRLIEIVRGSAPKASFKRVPSTTSAFLPKSQ
jgi:hypothetical protein